MKTTPAQWHIDWLTEQAPSSPLKEQALEHLLRTGMWSPKLEAYRYFPITPILSQSYDLEVEACRECGEGEVLVIENGVLQTKPQGIEVQCTPTDMLAQNHFDPSYYIGHLLAPQAIKMRIDNDTQLAIVHRVNENEILCPYRICLEVAEGVKVTIDERFESSSAHDSLLLYGIDLDLKAHSMAVWVSEKVMQEDDSKIIASHYASVAKEATLELHTFDFGDSRVLGLWLIELMEESRLDADHLLMGSGSGTRGNAVQIVHKAPDAVTEQNAKAILAQKAKGIFDGLIRVEHSGKGAVTHQNSKTILLGNEAFMVSKPQLEIYIDELEASHGSTTGEIDEAQLFYLQSRGISRAEAKKMLIFAFVQEMIERVDDEAIAKRIEAAFEKLFEEMSL